jgi:hypothetical protein
MNATSANAVKSSVTITITSTEPLRCGVKSGGGRP